MCLSTICIPFWEKFVFKPFACPPRPRFPLFIYLRARTGARQLERAWTGRRGRGRFPASWEPDSGPKPRTPGSMTWAKGRHSDTQAPQLPVSIWVTYLFIVELCMYSWCKSLIRHMICIYFLPSFGLSFYFLDRVLWSIKVFNFNKVQFICFVCSCLCF